MAISWTTAVWFLPFVLPIAIWVAWSDMATMKIPNKAVLALLLVFAIVGLIALPFTDYLWRYAHFGVVLVVGFLMSSLGMVGAGDAKFAAAMAPFVAREDWFAVLFLLAGASFAAFVVHRLVRASSLRQKVPDWESWTSRAFPMGFALAPTLVIYLTLPIIFGY